MTDDQRRQRVEDACARLVAEGAPVIFDDLAVRAGIGRATLYRNPDLRTSSPNIDFPAARHAP